MNYPRNISFFQLFNISYRFPVLSRIFSGLFLLNQLLLIIIIIQYIITFLFNYISMRIYNRNIYKITLTPVNSNNMYIIILCYIFYSHIIYIISCCHFIVNSNWRMYKIFINCISVIFNNILLGSPDLYFIKIFLCSF